MSVVHRKRALGVEDGLFVEAVDLAIKAECSVLGREHHLLKRGVLLVHCYGSSKATFLCG